MIDSGSGTLSFSGHERRIDARLTKTDLLASDLSKNAELTVQNDLWSTWSLGIFGDRFGDFSIAVTFEGERLRFLTLLKNLPGGELGWSHWTEESEILRKQHHDAYLNILLGRERIFSWGSVSSSFDRKSAVSIITVSFSSQAPETT